MLHPFISTQAVRPERSAVSGLTLSVVLHASLVAAAVVATTSQETRAIAQRAEAVERIVFTRIAPRLEEAADAAVAAAKSAKRGIVGTVRPLRLPLPDVPTIQLSET